MSLTSKQINELRAYAKDRKGELAKMINDAAFTIEMLSIKQPDPKWIPCKKCMPEIGNYVICSQENGDVGEGKLLPDGNWLILYGSAEYEISWVTAWMPLPSAYREAGEQDA